MTSFTVISSTLLYSTLLTSTPIYSAVLYSALLYISVFFYILPHLSLSTSLFTTTIIDPSKVEMRVLQQMRQRELNHEMRNLSAKLTPAERRAKRNAKLQEDTSRQVFIAVFRIKDFSDAKHRWVDGDVRYV